MSHFRSITVSAGLTALALALMVTPALAQNRRFGPRPQNQRQNQAGHAGQWLRQHQNLPPEQQRRALENDPGFRNLPPQRQQQLRNQLDHFNHLAPDQQQRVLNRMETWEHLTPEQKGQARQLHSQMQQLPEERRQAIRHAVETLRGMPPDARQHAIESDDYKKRFSPQERDILNNASKLPLAPAEPSEPAPEE